MEDIGCAYILMSYWGLQYYVK